MGACPRACTSSGPAAWVPCGPPSCTRSGCAASGGSSRPTATASSRPTTRWPCCTARPRSASPRSPRRWSTCGRPSTRARADGRARPRSGRGGAGSAPAPSTIASGPGRRCAGAGRCRGSPALRAWVARGPGRPQARWTRWRCSSHSRRRASRRSGAGRGRVLLRLDGRMGRPASTAWADRRSSELVLDELRLQPERLASVRRLALLRLLARREAQRTGREPDRAALGQARTGCASGWACGARPIFDRWLAERDLDHAGFDLHRRRRGAAGAAGPGVGAGRWRRPCWPSCGPAAATLSSPRGRARRRRLSTRPGLPIRRREPAAIDLAPVLAALAERAGGEAGGDPRTLARQLGFARPRRPGARGLARAGIRAHHHGQERRGHVVPSVAQPAGSNRVERVKSVVRTVRAGSRWTRAFGSFRRHLSAWAATGR